VSLPSLTAFGKVPFSGCTSLTTVNLPAAPPSIDVAPESSNPGWYNGIFSNTSSTDDTDAISVIVPAGAGLAYSSTWNVSAHSSANSRPYIYGSNHKAVIFPDMADDPANNGSGLAGLEALANAPAGGNTADNPIPLMLSGNLTTNGWKAVCYTVDAAGKYVTLDLSACTMTGDKFAPGTDAGVEKITALALPDTAKSIKTAEMAGASPFNAFNALTSISGAGVETVDNQAFNYCMSLTSVNLPAATTIGYSAFYECRNLAEVSLPVAATIGDWAFYGCTSLTEVSLPVATDIGTRAFYSCKNLTEVSLPVAAAIGGGAFYGCTSLTEVSLPVATAIGGEAFRYCTNLTTVSLPATPPSIGDYIFRYTSSMDTVTILVPAGAVSAYTSAWGVSANTTAGGNTNKYGAGHKAVLITDAAQ
ncbi:MAG: leucine-rich repeat domain-containing protein, partial [Treponema sp.]|nr:leucine-rich repeat domain-containing protein [Treponema sp.]